MLYYINKNGGKYDKINKEFYKKGMGICNNCNSTCSISSMARFKNARLYV